MGSVVGGVGSIIEGNSAADAQKNAANNALQSSSQAVSNYNNIDIPTIQEQVLQLQQLKSVGELTPEQETALQQGQTTLASIQTDPAYKDAQMSALKSLQQIGANNGLTSMDKAQLNDITNQTNNQSSSARNAILQNAQARGMGGSGVELAALLAGNQTATQTASDNAFNVAAQAQNRALQALQGAGTLSSSLQSNQFNQEAQKAAAQDAINNFNTQNAQNVQSQNVQRANYAQQANLTNAQNIANQNVGLANQQDQYNQGLYQTNYANQLSKAAGQSNALTGQANQQVAVGNAEAAGDNAIGQGLAKIGTGIDNAAVSYFSPTKTKTTP